MHVVSTFFFFFFNYSIVLKEALDWAPASAPTFFTRLEQTGMILEPEFSPSASFSSESCGQITGASCVLVVSAFFLFFWPRL